MGMSVSRGAPFKPNAAQFLTGVMQMQSEWELRHRSGCLDVSLLTALVPVLTIRALSIHQ